MTNQPTGRTMTVSYEEARAEAEALLRPLDAANQFRSGQGLPSVEAAIPISSATLRALLAGPPEREGWVLVPREPTPAMLERAAFNLCAEYGVEFVQPLGQFVTDAYAELLAAAPKP